MTDEMTTEITIPAAPALSGGPALHASERHDDFERHAEEHPSIADGYKSPKGAAAPHASERHDDFERHAEEHPSIADGYKSPKGKVAVHVKDMPGFAEAYRYDKTTGGYASTSAPTARRA